MAAETAPLLTAYEYPSRCAASGPQMIASRLPETVRHLLALTLSARRSVLATHGTPLE